MILHMLSYVILCSSSMIGICAGSQVLFVNDAILKAQPGSKLHGLAPFFDPSDEIIEVLLAALRWDMQQRRLVSRQSIMI